MKPSTTTANFFHTWEWTLNYLIIPKILIKQLILLWIVFEERGWLGLEKKQNITLEKVKSIVEMSY
jgi:NADP-dependent alcohol dehydrogenase